VKANYAELVLIGRMAERRALESLLAGARLGASGVLLITGEAGIGKTALIEHCAANSRGLAVHRVLGTDAERHLPFGGLSQLVGGDAKEIARLPLPQAQALAVALHLRPGPPPDRFAVGAATLALLSRRAEARPVVALVDDAHLLDDLSAQALLFAARRIVADPIAMVVAVRSGEPSVLLGAGLPELNLSGLDDESALALVTSGSVTHRSDPGRQPPPLAMERIVRACRGNPLALIELGARADVLDASNADVPLPVTAAVSRAFRARVRGLPAQAQRALLVAAASNGDRLVVAPACRALGCDPAALTAAEDAGLLQPAGMTLTFRHPLVRAAVYGAASGPELRTVHAALADATPPSDPDQQAWHRARATGLTDDAVAGQLDEVAIRARSRAAYDIAASALERAGELSTHASDRAYRLVSAAESAWTAGQVDRASRLLTMVGPPCEVDLIASVGKLRGRIAAETGSVRTALDIYADAAERVGHDRPDEAAELWADAVEVAFHRADAAYLTRALDHLDGLGPVLTTTRARILADLAAGMAAVLLGRGGPERIRRAVMRLATSDELRTDPARAPWLVLGPLFLREGGDEVRRLVAEAVSDARARTVLGSLARLLLHVGIDHATTNDWPSAETCYHEALHLAQETGQATEVALVLAALGGLEARMGRAEPCREHATQALSLCAKHDLVIGGVWSRLALGELGLGVGRPAEALTDLDAALDELRGHGLVDVDLDPGPERVEAMVRLGLHEQALAEAVRYHEQAVAKGQPWALARAERALGSVASDTDADACFERALTLHTRTVDDFEAARTRLAYGESLRRRRRRRDARAQLSPALAAFELLGAEGRAEQAAVELAAAGETVRRRGAGPITALTPQERQIAQLLAGGQTTRQAAAQLFLSPKTVEYHLRHVYTKLGVRSRVELVDLFAVVDSSA
jgi:DNA-binding CsgD family transcriptional regulator